MYYFIFPQSLPHFACVLKQIGFFLIPSSSRGLCLVPNFHWNNAHAKYPFIIYGDDVTQRCPTPLKQGPISATSKIHVGNITFTNRYDS